MSSVIQNLLDQAIGDGARQTKFECFIHFNSTGLFGNEKDIVALVKSSKFPGKEHDVINLKFKGRTIPVKGQVKYDNTWSCTFHTTENHALKLAFEDWIEAIDQQHNMKNVTSRVKRAQMFGYTTTMKIAQLDFECNEEMAVYTMYNCFPKSVSGINVDYTNVGPIMEFTVEFSYSYYDAVSTNANFGSFVEDIKNQIESGISNVVNHLKDSVIGVFDNVIANPINSVTNTMFSTASNAVDNMFSSIDW